MANPLFIEQAYLNGKFVSSNNQFDVINPSTNKPIGSLPNLTVADCEQSIIDADKAWKKWKNVPLGERSAITRRLFDLINKNKEYLAEIMTLESGKPLKESLIEVEYANAFFHAVLEGPFQAV